MPSDRHDDITSGFINPTQGEVFASFARRTTIDTPGHNLLVKVEHDGVWRLLKGLKPEYRDQGVYRALLRKEYDIAKHLQYPGVVGTLALIEDAELGPCIVMEWIEGITLGEWMDERHTRAERRDIAHQLIGVVEYLHRMNVVHRDLKPANVMVTLMGNNVIVIDFGLADKPSHALFKQAAGTEGYIPEEQLDEDAKPDARHDIYSLGKILQELKPGGPFAAVARRCCASLERRYPSIKALKDDFARREKVSKALRWVAGAIVVAALAVTGYRLSSRGSQESAQITNPAVSDTVVHHVHDTVNVAEQPQHEAGPTAPSVVVEMEPTTDPRVTRAIDQGKRYLDAEVAKTDLEARMAHLTPDDCYGNWSYFMTFFEVFNLNASTYAQSLDFNVEQRTTIENEVKDYYENTYLKRWKKCINDLPVTHEEWYRQQKEKAKKREAELDER